jgi:hypothetical protein
MLKKAFAWAGKRFAIILAVTLVIIAVVAFFKASAYESYWVAFKDTMFIGGIVVMAMGALIGAGASEFGWYNTRMFSLSSDYMHAVQDERLERRRQQVAFMIWGLALGLTMAVLPYVLP